MAKIRGKKEGSIHQRRNGTWQAQVTLEGRRLSFTARTRRECQEWLKKTIGQIDNGMTFASTTVTLGDYLAIWLTSMVSPPCGTPPGRTTNSSLVITSCRSLAP